MAMKVRYTVVNGQVLSENRNGVERDYIPDSQGNTIALMDSTGALTDTFSYFPSGAIASRTGTTPTPFQHGGGYGYYRDTPKRNYVRARNFYVNLGRWSTPDPIGFDGGDFNLYRYVNNRFVVLSDPSGLLPCDDESSIAPGVNPNGMTTCSPPSPAPLPCCCCADDLKIKVIAIYPTGIPPGAGADVKSFVGHLISVDYKLSTKRLKKSSKKNVHCTMEWWEKTNFPNRPEMPKNIWWDVFANTDGTNQEAQWLGHREPCPPDTFKDGILDPPGWSNYLGANNTFRRVLEIRPVLKSSEACKGQSLCGKPEAKDTFKQIIYVRQGVIVELKP